MKNRIRGILKEGDFDWAEGNTKDHYNQVETYVRWLNDLPYPWQRDLDDVLSSIGMLSSDTGEMRQLANIIEDPDQTKQRRLSALNEYESYAMLGGLIEHNKLYMSYIVDYSIMSGLSEYDVHELANEILNKGYHNH